MDVNPTEMVDIKVIRQDGVKAPASGFPILVMKSTTATGANDPAEPAAKAACDGSCCTTCGSNPTGEAPVAPETTAKETPDASTDLPGVRPADSDLQADGLPEAAPEGVTKTSEPEGSDGSNAELIEKAVAEAAKADRERIEALEAEVAKMRATPIPGGPMLTATAAQRDTRTKADALAKAAYHERQADTVGFSNRELARYHREKAAEAREAAAKA